MMEPAREEGREEMELRENLYALRTKKGLSQADLAEALEVSRQSVSKWETGVSHS